MAHQSQKSFARFFKTCEECIEYFSDTADTAAEPIFVQSREIYRLRNECFLLKKGMRELIEAVHQEKKILPVHAGIFLGKEKKGRFEPSLALLEILAPHSQKKAVIDEKSAWLFLCGRDVFISGILSDPSLEPGELVLVQNQRDENLGYGRICSGTVKIKNLLDRGDFLRREQSSPKGANNPKKERKTE